MASLPLMGVTGKFRGPWSLNEVKTASRDAEKSSSFFVC